MDPNHRILSPDARPVIRHIVLFRFADHASAEAIAAARDALRAMRDSISDIRDLTFGPNLGPSAGEWPHVLTVTVDSMAAVEAYLTHPVHVDTVARFVAPIREARMAIDVETA